MSQRVNLLWWDISPKLARDEALSDRGLVRCSDQVQLALGCTPAHSPNDCVDLVGI